MNYNDLVAAKTTPTSIAGWLNWDGAPATEILTEAQSFIYSTLRVREMKTPTSGNILANTTSLALPSGFLEAQSFRVTGDSAGEIIISNEKVFESRLPIDQAGEYVRGVPTECMIIGDPATAYFNLKPESNVPYRLVYFARPASLSASLQTNWLTDRYPTLLREACLARGYAYKKQWEAAQASEKRVLEMVGVANDEYRKGEEEAGFDPFSYGRALKEAEAFVYARLRVREMKEVNVDQIPTDATSIQLPGNFITVQSFRRTGDDEGLIEVLSEQNFEGVVAVDSAGEQTAGIPSKCMIIGSPPTAYFNFKASVPIPYRLNYFGRPAALSPTNRSNWLTERYPTILRLACVALWRAARGEMEQAEAAEKRAVELIEAANAEYAAGEGEAAYDRFNYGKILRDAESFIYSLLRVREMQKITTGTIATGATELAMPSDFIAPISFRRTGSVAGVIDILDKEHFEERLSLDETGAYIEAPPMECMILGSPAVAKFNYQADQDVPYRLVYFARPAAISPSNPTNWLTERYPVLLREICNSFGLAAKGDLKAAEIAKQNATAMINVANSEYDMGEAVTRFEPYSNWN